jgi:hypothetical protein
MTAGTPALNGVVRGDQFIRRGGLWSRGTRAARVRPHATGWQKHRPGHMLGSDGGATRGRVHVVAGSWWPGLVCDEA